MRLAATICATSLALFPCVAQAQQWPAEATGEAPADTPTPEDRPVPDYDGRGPAPTTAGDVLLWVPRVLFSPFYLVSEFVLRRPLGAFVTALEVDEDLAWLVDAFDFTKSSSFGVVPTAFVEFGFRANIGFYLFLDDVPVPASHFRIHAATGGSRYWKITIIERIPVSSAGAAGPFLGLRGHASRRQDYLYAGLGPDTRTGDGARYQHDRLEASLRLHIPAWRESSFRADAGIRRGVFGEGSCCGDPSVQTQADAGVFGSPPGIEDDFGVYFQSGRLVLDSRGVGPEPGTGFRLELQAEHAFDLESPIGRRWLEYRGAAGTYVAVAPRRIVGLVAGARFIRALGSAPVPFSELNLLGGDDYFRGFSEGRLHGHSSFAAAVEYRWPIWVWLDGDLQLSLGNVFGDRLEDLTLGRMRGSFAFGIRTAGSPDHALSFLIATGTETIDQGFTLTSFRLLIGTVEGF